MRTVRQSSRSVSRSSLEARRHCAQRRRDLLFPTTASHFSFNPLVRWVKGRAVEAASARWSPVLSAVSQAWAVSTQSWSAFGSPSAARVAMRIGPKGITTSLAANHDVARETLRPHPTAGELPARARVGIQHPVAPRAFALRFRHAFGFVPMTLDDDRRLAIRRLHWCGGHGHATGDAEDGCQRQQASPHEPPRYHATPHTRRRTL